MRTHALAMRLSFITYTCAVAACSDDATTEQVAVDHAALTAAAGSGAALAPVRPVLSNPSTSLVGQITNSETNPQAGLGMTGTDLGISYQRGDKLFFLFGDSWTDTGDPAVPPARRQNKDRDAIAWADAALPASGIPQLNWYRRSTTGADNNEFLPLKVPNIPDGPMSVPVEGVPIGADTYMFFHAYNQLTGQASSVLGYAVGDDFSAIKFLHQKANSKFQSVSTLTIGEELWIYGVGKYRNDQVYLARAHLLQLPDRSSWQYYNAPGSYLAEESNAQPLPLPLAANDAETCVGELSVRKHPTQELYFMAYNCDRTPGADQGPHHIRLRVARAPEGPWSEPLTIVQEHELDGAVTHEKSRGSHPTDVYGPYLIPAWFSDPEPGVVELAYTLSTWNPYQVQLVRTRVTIGDAN